MGEFINGSSESQMKTVERANLPKLLSIVVVATCVLLVVPYATGLATYWSLQGPAMLAARNILAATGLLAAAVAMKVRPRLSLSLWLLLALMCLRLLDSAMRGHGDYEFDPISHSIGPFLFCCILCALGGNVHGFRLAVIVSAILVLIVNGTLNFWEWFNPGYFSTVEGRSAGLLGNANVAAYSIALMLGGVLAAGIPRTLGYALICIAALGIFFTLSRGGAVSWLLVVGVYIVATFEARSRSLALGFILLAASGLVIFYLIASIGVDDSNADVQSRFDLFSGQVGSLDVNDSSRVDLFLMSLDGIKRAPLQGFGTFSASSIFRPHNQFLAVWLDNGIIGLILFVSAICVLGWECFKARRPVLFVGYAALLSTTPFSHNLLEDYSFLPAWVACAMFAMAKQNRQDEKAPSNTSQPLAAT